MQLEQNIKKAGETIQIVKTVLAMKLQSEQKLVSAHRRCYRPTWLFQKSQL